MSEAPQQAQAVPHRSCQLFYIIYIMRNGVMRRLAWVWLWIKSCLPSREPNKDEIAA
jgi:hypothetical protein